MNPPSYKESTIGSDGKSGPSSSYPDSKLPQRLSIREEIGQSREQYATALAARLVPHLRARARKGLAKSKLIVLPSDQDCSRKGQLVGFSESPIAIQLEGSQDVLEFWTQTEAIESLRNQLYAELTEDFPLPQALPERPAVPTAAKSSSLFSRKQSKRPQTPPQPEYKPPATVEVQLDEVSFRSETEFGLFETLRGRCILIDVDIR